MSGVSHHQVADHEAGDRLDRWFKRHFPDVPFGRLQKLTRTGQIRVDGKRVKPADRLDAGADIRVPPLTSQGPADRSQISDRDLKMMDQMVLHQDKDLIIFNKPAGLAVQGGSGQKRHLDGLMKAWAEQRNLPRPKLVHRLDRDTSGLLVVALSGEAARVLTKAFQGRDVEKTYWAVTVRGPQLNEGRIKAPLAKRSGKAGRETMHVVEPGDADAHKAETEFVVLDRAGKRASLVACRPRTGRTHQLRVHLAYMNCPILGDRKYGGDDAVLDGLPGKLSEKLHLHARSLRFPHPNGTEVYFEAPPSDQVRETFAFFDFDPGLGDPFDGEAGRG